MAVKSIKIDCKVYLQLKEPLYKRNHTASETYASSNKYASKVKLLT